MINSSPAMCIINMRDWNQNPLLLFKDSGNFQLYTLNFVELGATRHDRGDLEGSVTDSAVLKKSPFTSGLNPCASATAGPTVMLRTHTYAS